VLTAVTLALIASVSVTAQTEIVTKLGSSVEEAHDAIFGAFSTGAVQMVGVSDVFKTAGAQTRVALVTAAITFARGYTGTADFARRYGVYREEQRPPADAPPAADASALNAEQRTALQEGIASMEQTAKQFPQMKKELDAQIAEMRKQLAAIGTSKEADAQMNALLKQGAQDAAAEHKQRLMEWENRYPADPKRFIAMRLRQFLALSATVDYSARLTKAADGMMRFENPQYEQKDNQWKYLYRAGKPAVDAARALAQDWLKSLGG